MIEVAGMEFIDNINVKQAEVNKEKEIQLSVIATTDFMWKWT